MDTDSEEYNSRNDTESDIDVSEKGVVVIDDLKTVQSERLVVMAFHHSARILTRLALNLKCSFCFVCRMFLKWPSGRWHFRYSWCDKHLLVFFLNRHEGQPIYNPDTFGLFILMFMPSMALL